jgi:hypothetical protein
MKHPPIKKICVVTAAFVITMAASSSRSMAEDAVGVHITLKNHKFSSAEPHAPAGKPIIITLKNLDPTPAEFESNMLRVEKVVTGGGTITIRIRALEPGRYRFFDDFNPTAEGYLVVQ